MHGAGGLVVGLVMLAGQAGGIAYEVVGEGLPIVLLHGFSDARASWREHGYVDALVAAGRQAILIDARGHGDSLKPLDPADYALEHRVADVIAVLDRLGIERADLWGYSMGGWIALGLVRDFPERVRSAIVGGAHPYAQRMAFYREAVVGGLEGWAATVERLAGRPLPGTRARVLANDVHALAAAVADDREDISADLATGMPLLLYAGLADPVHEPASRFAEAAGARFVGLPDRNHIQALLDTEAILPEALAFLSAASGE
jgi:pimeloyl-ACP methyl ester carboxylesterase